MSLFVVPEANHALKVHLFNLIKSRAMIGIEPGVFSSTFDGMVIYVDKMGSSNQMEGIFISDERSPKDPYAIVAQRGELIADPQSLQVTLAMKQGSIQAAPRNDQSYSVMSFESGKLFLDISHALLRQGSSEQEVEETNSLELLRTIKRATVADNSIIEMKDELHKRLSIPFVCLLFGMIGAPLGIRKSRSGKSAGIAIALLVFLVYYMVFAAGMNLSKTGQVAPALAFWIPNLVMTILSAVFLFKKGRDIDFSIFSAIASAYYRWRARRKRTF
jgi:lipopolysaccharide export system permease protein